MTDQFLLQIVQVGAVGATLAWFLIRLDPRIKHLEEAINRMVRAQMLFILASEYTPESYRREARSILQEIEGTTNGKPKQ